ncbi:hypothetical protein BDD12DRAFT_533538 [Trichophaea hybrida]|nr:hypothetical protein BDD12DRAFT_533538 [Trichophaea hybrida]
MNTTASPVMLLAQQLYGQNARIEAFLDATSTDHNNHIYLLPEHGVLVRYPISDEQRPYTLQTIIPGVTLSSGFNSFSYSKKKRFVSDYIEFLRRMEDTTFPTYGYLAAQNYRTAPETTGPGNIPILNFQPTILRCPPKRNVVNQHTWQLVQRPSGMKLDVAGPRRFYNSGDPVTGETYVDPTAAPGPPEPTDLIELLISRIHRRIAFDGRAEAKTLKMRRERAIEQLREIQEYQEQGVVKSVLSVDDCVFYHTGLQRRNILADPDTGALTGIVDWDQAESRPRMFARASSCISWLWDERSSGDGGNTQLMMGRLYSCQCSRNSDGTTNFCRDESCRLRTFCRRRMNDVMPGYFEDATSIQDVEQMLFYLAMDESTWGNGDLILLDNIIEAIENRMEEETVSDFDYGQDESDDDSDEDVL